MMPPSHPKRVDQRHENGTATAKIRLICFHCHSEVDWEELFYPKALKGACDSADWDSTRPGSIWRCRLRERVVSCDTVVNRLISRH